MGPHFLFFHICKKQLEHILLENTEILRQEQLSSEEMKRIDEILDSRLQEEDRGRAI